MIATTALYLAGKIEEQELRLTDVINVCHRFMTFHSDDCVSGIEFTCNDHVLLSVVIASYCGLSISQ